MKAFLMYRDRDFDPQQILAGRDNERNARRMDPALSLERLLPWNERALVQDLGLEPVLSAMALGDAFLSEVSKVGLLASVDDPDAALYRQRVLSDCLSNPQIVKELYQIAIDAIDGEKKDYYWSFLASSTIILHRSVHILQMFSGMLRRLRNVADRRADQFISDGFQRLFAMLRAELSDEYFARIEDHLRRLKFRDGVLVSAGLGAGNKGVNYVLRKPREDRRGWLTRIFGERAPSYTFELHPRDEAGAHALSALNDRGVTLVAKALAQSTEHILNFFKMLRTELAFYIGCLNLHDRLRQFGEPTCFPVPGRASGRKLSFLGLYDASLALCQNSKVVSNDLDADTKDIVIITGANTGGKSTFLRSVGLAQLMMQAGMFVPAEAFSSEVCNGLFTHYKREEDVTMESGKWDEELKRMSEIVDHIEPNSLLLFNESFASTNEREGSEIASQIVRALLEKNVRIFFVTHLYHFAHSFFIGHSNRVKFLRAERRPDGTRSFKLTDGEPLQTSYGEDLYSEIFGEKRPATVA